MQISERWLRSFVDPPLGSDELAHLLTMSGVEVETCSPVAPPFSGVVVGQVTDRKSTRLNSSHTVIYTLSLHDALPISRVGRARAPADDVRRRGRDLLAGRAPFQRCGGRPGDRSEEHTSELQSHRDLHSFPTRRSSDLSGRTSSRTC